MDDFSIKGGRRIIILAFALFTILSMIYPIQAVGKNDLQVTIDMKDKVYQGEKGSVTVTYKNAGKYKIAFIRTRVSSTALDMDEKNFEFELPPGEKKETEIGFKVKPERKGKNFLYVTLSFCIEIPAGIPPCPVFTNIFQKEFTILDSPPPTTSPPVISEKFEISIVSPTAGSTFALEEPVTFEASSSQKQSQTYYVWESDIDGLLGQSQRFSRTLSEGMHTVTLTAKSGAQAAEATVKIEVKKAEIPQTTLPPQTPTIPEEENSRLRSFLTFIGILVFSALFSIGVILYLPKRRKGKKRRMGSHTLNICPSCGRNNSSTAARCWKCKAPLR